MAIIGGIPYFQTNPLGWLDFQVFFLTSWAMCRFLTTIHQQKHLGLRDCRAGHVPGQIKKIVYELLFLIGVVEYGWILSDRYSPLNH